MLKLKFSPSNRERLLLAQHNILAIIILTVLAIIITVSAVSIIFYWYSYMYKSIASIIVHADSNVTLKQDTTVIYLHIQNNSPIKTKIHRIKILQLDLNITSSIVKVVKGNAILTGDSIILSPYADIKMYWILNDDPLKLYEKPLSLALVEIIYDNGIRIRTQIPIYKPR